MLEEILAYISTLDTNWVYVIIFFFAFIENVFPPSPSDVVIVAGAALIATTTIGFIPVLILTSIGSALGFMLMYYVGDFFGDKVLEQRKIKFITPEMIETSSKWFNKYGYAIIVANRFLPGTRSAISFFAGVYELKQLKTFLAALASAFLWFLGLVYLGMVLGQNVELIDYYLSTYTNIIIGITAAVVIVLLVRFLIKRYTGKKKETDED